LYVRRSLEGYPGITPLSGLASGYEAIAGFLPVGSPVLLFALQRLAQRAQDILRKPGGLLQPGLDLVSLLAHLMLLIDYNVSPDLPPVLLKVAPVHRNAAAVSWRRLLCNPPISVQNHLTRNFQSCRLTARSAFWC